MNWALDGWFPAEALFGFALFALDFPMAGAGMRYILYIGGVTLE